MDYTDKKSADSYDESFSALQPWKDSLHLCLRFIFSTLSSNKQAKVLCVGVGTGAELSYLARAFPNCSFTAVEPAEAMLNICKVRAEKEGYLSRCTFHNGYLDSLTLVENEFDAATSLYVSHFLVNEQERISFFQEIGKRLKLGGCLVNADLAFPGPASSHAEHENFWREAFLYSGMSKSKVDSFLSTWGKSISVLSPNEVANIVEAAGFKPPIQCNQNILMHAWYTHRC